MSDEEIKYHEHDLERVEKPAVRQAKTLCMFVLAVCVGGLYFYFFKATHEQRMLIDAYSTWPCVIVGVVVAIVALRAVLS